MSRYAHVAYCDDIRPEINGKMSLIGLYSDKMLLPDIPASLPKLGILVTAKTSFDEPFEGFEIHMQPINMCKHNSSFPPCMSTLLERLRYASSPANGNTAAMS